MKIAFVFPGQGTQYVGMGKDIYENSITARNIYTEATKISNIDIASLSFIGPKEVLYNTEIQQPTIHTLEIALFSILKNEGITPDVCAGYSLGEYAALVCSDILDFKNSIHLVSKRGRIINETIDSGIGKMALIKGLSVNEIEAIIKESSKINLVELSNYNTKYQSIISGYKEAVEFAANLAKDKGAEKISFLNVSSPFHTSILEPSALKFLDELTKVSYKPPKIKYIPNVSAEIYQNENMPNLLYEHIWKPVRWRDTIIKIISCGVDFIIEIGPSKSLTKFNQEIIEELRADVKCFNVQNQLDIKKIIKILKE